MDDLNWSWHWGEHGRGPSWEAYLQKRDLVAVVNGGVRRSAEYLSACMGEHSRAIVGSVEALEQSLDNRLGELNGSLTGGLSVANRSHEIVADRLSEVNRSLDDLVEAFTWGFEEVLASIGGMNRTLRELLKASEAPEQKKAYEQYSFARDAFRKSLYPEALEALDKAINGVAGISTGYKLEWRFHYLRGIILLGSYKTPDIALLDSAAAEEAFLTAARYSRKDYPQDAGRALLAAGWAAYVQTPSSPGSLARAQAHTAESIKMDSQKGESWFQAAKFSMAANKTERGCMLLRKAADFGGVYIAKAAADGDFKKHGAIFACLLDELHTDTAENLVLVAANLRKEIRCLSTNVVSMAIPMPSDGTSAKPLFDRPGLSASDLAKRREWFTRAVKKLALQRAPSMVLRGALDLSLVDAVRQLLVASPLRRIADIEQLAQRIVDRKSRRKGLLSLEAAVDSRAQDATAHGTLIELLDYVVTGFRCDLRALSPDFAAVVKPMAELVAPFAQSEAKARCPNAAAIAGLLGQDPYALLLDLSGIMRTIKTQNRQDENKAIPDGSPLRSEADCIVNAIAELAVYAEERLFMAQNELKVTAAYLQKMRGVFPDPKWWRKSGYSREYSGGYEFSEVSNLLGQAKAALGQAREAIKPTTLFAYVDSLVLCMKACESMESAKAEIAREGVHRAYCIELEIRDAKREDEAEEVYVRGRPPGTLGRLEGGKLPNQMSEDALNTKYDALYNAGAWRHGYWVSPLLAAMVCPSFMVWLLASMVAIGITWVGTLTRFGRQQETFLEELNGRREKLATLEAAVADLKRDLADPSGLMERVRKENAS